MKIITKDYDNNGKLRILNNKSKKTKYNLRFKVLKNGKEFLCCDFEGKCTNKAYAEVYPSLLRKKRKDGVIYVKNIILKNKKD